MASSRTTRPYNVSVIVTSDSCSENATKDLSGTYLVSQLGKMKELFANTSKIIVPDEQNIITETIKSEIRRNDPALVITVGGTGMSPRDSTPEACKAIYDKECSGVVAALNFASLRHTAHAAISRLTSGIIGETLLINFPGSLKACKDCFACMLGFIEHALEQIRFDATSYKSTHVEMSKSGSISNDDRDAANDVWDTNSPTSKAVKVQRRALSLKQSGSQTSVADKSTLCKTKDRKDRSSEPHKNSRLSIKEILDSCNDSHRDIPVVGHGTHPAVDHDVSSANTATSKHNFESTTVKSMRTTSPFNLISHADSLAILQQLSPQLLHTQEKLALRNFPQAYMCIGNVLARDLHSRVTIPACSASTMDGYVINVPVAFRSTINHIIKLPPVKVLNDFEQFKQAQSDPEASKKFFCYQVNTGGKLPERRFAVIPVEKTEPLTEDTILVKEVKQGCYVRKTGCDMSGNDYIRKGTVIGPVELSLIIAMRHREITVLRRPSLGFISTGDELVSFFSEQIIDNDAIIDTNGPLLSSIFRSDGYNSYDYGIVADDREALIAAISLSIQECDVLLITGGASMGSKDHVKDAIKKIGAEIHFGRVNIKPGNPVSAYVTSLVLVKPFLYHAIRHHYSPQSPITLDCIGDPIDIVVVKLLDYLTPNYVFDGRLEFIRARIMGRKDDADRQSPYIVAVSLRQQSSCMLSMMDCDCLIIITPEKKGSRLEVGQTHPALKMHKRV